jgi:hypothetical protein
MRSMYLLFNVLFLCAFGAGFLYSMEAPENVIPEENAESKQATFGEPFKISIQELYGKALETNSLLLLVYTYAQLLYNNKEQYSTLKTLGQTFLDALKIQLEKIAEKAGCYYGEQSKPMDYQKCVTFILKGLKAEELAAEVYTFLKSRPQTSNIIALLMAHVLAFLERYPAFSLFITSPAVTLTLKNEASYMGRLLSNYYNEQAKIRCSVLDFKVESQAFEQVYDYAMSLQKGTLSKEEVQVPPVQVPMQEQPKYSRPFLDLNAPPSELDELSDVLLGNKEGALDQAYNEDEEIQRFASSLEKELEAGMIARLVIKKGINIDAKIYENQLTQQLTAAELNVLHNFVQNQQNASMSIWTFIAYKIGGLSTDVRQMVIDIMSNGESADLSLLEDMISQLGK